MALFQSVLAWTVLRPIAASSEPFSKSHLTTERSKVILSASQCTANAWFDHYFSGQWYLCMRKYFICLDICFLVAILDNRLVPSSPDEALHVNVRAPG